MYLFEKLPQSLGFMRLEYSTWSSDNFLMQKKNAGNLLNPKC